MTYNLLYLASGINLSLAVAQQVIIFFTNDYLLLNDTIYLFIDGLLLLSPKIIELMLDCCEFKCKNNKATNTIFVIFVNGFAVGYRLLIIITSVIELISLQTPLKNYLYSLIIGYVGFVVNLLAFILCESHERIESNNDEYIFQALFYCLLPDAISSLFIGILAILNYTISDISIPIEYTNLSLALLLSCVFGFLSIRLSYQQLLTIKSTFLEGYLNNITITTKLKL